VPDAPTLRRRALLYAAAFVALAMLVQATDFDRLNSFAVRHLQPIAGGKGYPTLNTIAEALIAPGSAILATVLVLLVSGIIWAHGRRREAMAWSAALIGAIAIEIVCKLLISQHRSGAWAGYGFTFDSSFPSGHMVRVMVMAAAMMAVWPALRRPLELWCVAVAVCLLVTGWHLPTDIAGGLLAGMALVCWARSVGAPRRVRLTSSCGGSSSPGAFSSQPSSSPRTAQPAPDPVRTSGSR
jgi:membrane-associated phospholipid phosphatase